MSSCHTFTMGNYLTSKTQQWLQSEHLDTEGLDKLIDEVGSKAVYCLVSEPRVFNNEALMYKLIDRVWSDLYNPRGPFAELVIQACHANKQLKYFYYMSYSTYFAQSYLPDVLQLGNVDMLQHLLTLNDGAWSTWMARKFSHDLSTQFYEDSFSLTIQAILVCSSVECIQLLHQHGLRLNPAHMTFFFALWNALPQKLTEVLLLVDEPHMISVRTSNVSLANIVLLQGFNAKFSTGALEMMIGESQWAKVEQVLRCPELVTPTLDSRSLQRSFRRAEVSPEYWDDFPLVYRLMKRLYYQWYDWNHDEGDDEVVKAYIVNHEERLDGIQKLLKTVVKHEDVVDHILMQYL